MYDETKKIVALTLNALQFNYDVEGLEGFGMVTVDEIAVGICRRLAEDEATWQGLNRPDGIAVMPGETQRRNDHDHH